MPDDNKCLHFLKIKSKIVNKKFQDCLNQRSTTCRSIDLYPYTTITPAHFVPLVSSYLPETIRERLIVYIHF